MSLFNKNGWLKLNLQFFATDGVEGGGFANPQGGEGGEPGGASIIDDPNVSPEGGEPSATPEGDELDNSKAFAQRLSERTEKALAEARTQWEQEQQEKYGKFDAYEKNLLATAKMSGFNTIEEFQEALAEAELQERAQKQGITPEMQQRLEALEQEAAKGRELQQQREQEESVRQFREYCKTFASENGVEADKLEEFMMTHQIPSFDIALKAMKADEWEQQLKDAKEIAVKEYLASKKAPKVEGSGNSGVVNQEPPKSWAESRSRALERLNSNNKNE